MQAKINGKIYNLATDGINETSYGDAKGLRLTLTGVESLDALKEDAMAAGDIEVLDNDEVINTYKKYVIYMSLTDEDGTASVAVRQKTIAERLEDAEARQGSQEAEITEIQEVLVED